MLASLALIVAGAILGGPWRWVAGAVALALLGVIVVPGFVKDKQDNNCEGEMQ